MTLFGQGCRRHPLAAHDRSLSKALRRLRSSRTTAATCIVDVQCMRVNVCRRDRGGASAPPRPSRTEASAYLLLLTRPLQPPRLVERVEVGSSLHPTRPLLILKPTNRASRMPPSACTRFYSPHARRRVEQQQVEQGRRASRSSRKNAASRLLASTRGGTPARPAGRAVPSSRLRGVYLLACCDTRDMLVSPDTRERVVGDPDRQRTAAYLRGMYPRMPQVDGERRSRCRAYLQGMRPASRTRRKVNASRILLASSWSRVEAEAALNAPTCTRPLKPLILMQVELEQEPGRRTSQGHNHAHYSE